MKKKVLGLLCGGIMAFSLFAAPGNSVQAAKQNNDDCTCPVDLVYGAERNKLVATAISSEAFKIAKFKLLNSGFKWNGASSVQVGYPHLPEGVEAPEGYQAPLVVLIPFFHDNGEVKVAFYHNGAVIVEDADDSHSH